MATHDYVIANGTGAAVRSDLNDALAAIVSNNSGTSEPSTTYAYQWWADTTANVLKIRNSANNAWITLRELDGTMLIEDGSAASPGLSFASDTNTGFFRGGENELGITTGGTQRMKFTSGEAIINEVSSDYDFRVESNGNTHMLFVDAGNDRIGIGTNSPDDVLDVRSGAAGLPQFVHASGQGGLRLAGTGASSSANLVFSNNHTSGVSDEYTIQMSGDNDRLAFRSGGPSDTERVTFTADGKVGIGVSAPAAFVHLQDNNPFIRFVDSVDTSHHGHIGYSDSSALVLDADVGNAKSGSAIVFKVDNNEDARLDSSGRLLLGSSSDVTGSTNHVLQAVTTGGGRITLARNDTSVTTGDVLGQIGFSGNDANGSYQQVASITCEADGAHSDSDKPGRLRFMVTADGAGSPSEAMRISNTQHVSIGTTTANRTFQVGKSGAETFELEPGESSNNNLSLHFNRSSSSYITNEVRAIDHRFLSSTSEKVRVSSNGLSFNGDTASANMLDDYEEGTFTPSIANRTITTAEANYVKIGELVRFNIIVQGLNSSLTGTDILIGGLPYPSKNANGIGLIEFGDVSGVTYEVGFSNIYGRINGNVSYIQLLQQKTDGSVHDAFSGYSGKGLGTGVILRGFGWYMTA